MLIFYCELENKFPPLSVVRWLAEHVDVVIDKNLQSFSLISGWCLHLLFDDTLEIMGCDDSMWSVNQME